MSRLNYAKFYTFSGCRVSDTTQNLLHVYTCYSDCKLRFEMRNTCCISLCCFISSVYMLLSVFLYYNLFPRFCFTSLTTNSPQMSEKLYQSSFGNEITLDTSRTVNQSHTVQTEQKTSRVRAR